MVYSNGVIVSHQIQDEMAKLQTTSFKLLFKTLCLHCKPQKFGRKLRSIDSRLAPSFHNLFPARQLTVLFLLLPIFVALGHANRRVSTWPSSGRSVPRHPLGNSKTQRMGRRRRPLSNVPNQLSVWPEGLSEIAQDFEKKSAKSAEMYKVSQKCWFIDEKGQKIKIAV